MSTTRSTENFSITFPLEMLKRAQSRARAENRTMSELLREAFRQYELKNRWDELLSYGQAKAEALGISEEDVPRIIKEWRREQKRESNQRSQ